MIDEGSLWISAILFGTIGLPVILFAWLFMRKGIEPAKQALGLFKINDFAIEKIRLAVIAGVKDVKIEGIPRQQAEGLVENAACHAIAKTFSEIYPGRPFEVKRSWPQARCIISGNVAVVDCWIGLDFADDGEGIKPVNIEVRRAPVLKLDTRKPVSEALNESHGVPNGRLQPPKTESISKPKPARANMRKS